MSIAIIPARGGSKRIPRKNIKHFQGKPLIAYSIEAAKASGLFSRVVVSTDDREIADVSREWGAQTPFIRPAELSDDHAGTLPVLQHALERLSEEGPLPGFFCCIYPTAPLLKPEFLCQAFEKLKASDKTCAFAAAAFPAPIFRSFRLREDLSVEMFWPEHYRTRSQDLPEAYHDAGQFYWFRTTRFSPDAPVFSSSSLAHVLPRRHVVDIDTQEDWDMAEAMYELLFLRQSQP